MEIIANFNPPLAVGTQLVDAIVEDTEANATGDWIVSNSGGLQCLQAVIEWAPGLTSVVAPVNTVKNRASPNLIRIVRGDNDLHCPIPI
jgi:hypothetical protein